MGKQHSPGFLKVVEEAKRSVQECTVDEIKGRLDDGEQLLLVDVREESEFAAGHLVGAIHLSKGVIERDIEKAIPDPSAALVLYCGGGYRSALAAEMIQRMGYTNVISMDGGWTAWKAKQYPTEV